MIGFKQQAHRWTKGSFQTAIKLLPRILRSKQLSWGIKMEAFYHLTNTLVYPLMVMLTLLMYPVFFGYVDNVEAPLKGHTWGHYLFSVGLFILATASASTFFVFGQRELFGDKAGWKTILYMPFLMSLGVGLGLNNAKAVFEAIWGSIRRKPSEFVRTPKYGVTGNDRRKLRGDSVLTFKRIWLPLLEIAFGVYMASCIVISLLWGFGYGTIAFLLIFAGGYFYVGFSSLATLWKMNQQMELDQPIVADAAESLSA